MAGYLTLYAATVLGALFVGTTLNALLVRALFHRLGGARSGRLALPGPAHPGRFVWGPSWRSSWWRLRRPRWQWPAWTSAPMSP